MPLTDAFYGSTIFFQHEVLEASIDAYKKRLEPKRKLELLADILKYHEKFQFQAVSCEEPTEEQIKWIRDSATELAALLTIYVHEYCN